MRAVVTGATGCIGMALVEQLVTICDGVLVLCRDASAKEMILQSEPNVTAVVCPLEKMHGFYGDGQSYDAFFHLAWAGTTGQGRDDVHMQTENVKYALDALLLASRMGCKVFVGAGSQAEYGRTELTLTPNTPAFPETAYGSAKLCAGQMSKILASQLNLRHVWARILSVYGPYESESSMISVAIRKLLRGERVSFTAGEQTWDYLYSSDAARALISLALNKRCAGVYCIASGHSRKLREYIEIIRDAASPGARLGIGEKPYAAGQVMSLRADVTALARDSGFYPQVTFEEGIRKTVQWYREREKNEKNKRDDSML